MVESETERPHRASGRIVLMLICFGLGLPFLWWWLLVGRAPSLSPVEVRQRLARGEVRLVAVEASVQASLSEIGLWPLGDILAIHRPDEIPTGFQGKPLVLICSGGIQSALATRHLSRLGLNQVHSLRGGLQAWISEGKDNAFFRPSPPLEQLAAVFSFFGVKSIYSLLSLALAALLWAERAADLAALRRGMLAFFIGEAFCFINVLFFGDQSVLMEHLHSVGMVLSLGFTVYALLEGLDARLVRFSGPGHCAFQGLCRACFKQAEIPCGLRRMFLLSLPACAVTAALPLFAPFQHEAYTTRIMGVLHGYRHPVLHQLYELRFLPWAAILLFTACLGVLLLLEQREVPLSKALFAAAMGAMAFSYFRLVLVAVFAANQVWFAAWEEISELVFVGMACGAIWLFRRSLITQAWFAREGSAS